MVEVRAERASKPPVTVRAPAKINLHLGVGAPREDGFHPLMTVYHAVDLHDDVTVTDADEWSVTVSGSTDGVPCDDTNLAVRAGRALAAHHQTWVRDRETGSWRLDLFREPWESDTWVFRRDPRVRLPLERAIATTPEAIPYLRPEIVLLFKAKAPSAKDEADRAAALPQVDQPARVWLREALQLVHPSHEWLAALQD